jgi:hypothetical protein
MGATNIVGRLEYEYGLEGEPGAVDVIAPAATSPPGREMVPSDSVFHAALEGIFPGPGIIYLPSA